MNQDNEMIKYIERRYRDFLENIDNRPYWQWVAIEDPSLCPMCALLNNKVFRYDDPIWQKMLQRLHNGCRCRFRAYNEQDLAAKGLRVINSAEIDLKEAKNVEK